MTTSITDFLPKYPSIDIDVPLNPYDEDFYDVIKRKKEFYDEKLPKTENFPDSPGELMKHQKLISRFLSTHTPYDSILLVHSMGTGKTCSSIGAIEQIKKEENGINGALILAKGKPLLDNYTNEVIFRCTSGQYIPENYEKLTKLEKTHREKKSIRDWYQMDTFESMAKEIKKTPDEVLKERYNNKIIVIDEVHNLRQRESGIATYKQFHRFLHVVENCKIILMSGTPMKDAPEEISAVMNLILPLDKQLPTGDNFLERYFLDKNEDVLQVNEEYIEELREAFKGRVSYLKTMQSEVRKEYMGENVGDLGYFKIVEDKMSNFQSKYYRESYERDLVTKGIYNNSRQSSLFVFPDGSWGADGFKKYIKKVSSKRVGRTGSPIYTFAMQKSLIDAIKGKDNEETLKKLYKFSSKFASTIKNILKSQEKGESGFVYCEFVTGSGAILFSKILGLFGFSEANGNEKSGDEKLRYGLITNETATRKKLKDVIERFNKPDNMNGKIINIIIGSSVISEGFSLRNVQNVNIITPYWNYSETDQAIARGYRLGSHIDLLNNGIIPVVKVYQRISVPDNDTASIDLMMYELSEFKDVNIKMVERLILEMDVFCSLVYERNHVVGYEGQRECEYMDCEYTCQGTDDFTELDVSTYNLYYIDKTVKEIITKVSFLFQSFFSLDFTTIRDRLSEYSLFEILTSLETMINNNISIKNRYGFSSYLREHNNMYFLIDNLSVKGNFSTVYYTENPNIKRETNFSKIIDEISSVSLPNVIKNICSNKNKPIKSALKNLPLKIQEMILENAILAKEKGIDGWFRDSVLKYYKSFYAKINNVWMSWFLLSKFDIVRCLNGEVWGDCTEKKKKELDKKIMKDRKKLENNDYGYYAIKNPQTNDFCIKDTTEDIEQKDKRKNKTGRRCKDWGRKKLVKMAVIDLAVDAPEIYKPNATDEELWKHITKNKYLKELFTDPDEIDEEEKRRVLYWGTLQVMELCTHLEQWFVENNLVIEDHSCGSRPTKQTVV